MRVREKAREYCTERERVCGSRTDVPPSRNPFRGRIFESQRGSFRSGDGLGHVERLAVLDHLWGLDRTPRRYADDAAEPVCYGKAPAPAIALPDRGHAAASCNNPPPA